MGISQITTVKGRYDIASKHIKRWLSSGIDELIIVDYNCPQQTGLRLAEEYKSALGLTIVIVKPELTGKYFNLSKARNIGAIAAKNDTLFFCDADAWVTSAFIERAKDKLERTEADLLVYRLGACEEELIHKVNGDIPTQWAIDGQCFVKNYIFHTLNGYNESNASWGGEAYDLYIRVAAYGAKIGMYESRGLNVVPHDDSLRIKYLEDKFDQETRRAYYYKSLGRLKRGRKLRRINPGAHFGINTAGSTDLTLIRNGKQKIWRPGEDDIV